MKSEGFVINGDNEIIEFHANMFNCQVGTLPMRYLGVPINFAGLKDDGWMMFLYGSNSLSFFAF
jgi:hypothetical protein